MAEPVTITEDTAGPNFAAASAESVWAIIGTASAGPLNTPRIARNDRVPGEEFGVGRLAEVGAIVVGEGRQPAVLVRAETVTDGDYGAVDDSAFDGTAIPVADTTVIPVQDAEPYVRFVAGGTLGQTGITYYTSPDGGKTLSALKSLATGTYIDEPFSGARLRLGPPAAQEAAFIAAAVEARADTLAHLADALVHLAADTSPEQVALAASSVPTTAAQAWAVANLCLAAFAVHQLDDTLHNGPDPVNVVSSTAATDVHTGIDLFIEYKSEFNAHLGVALAGAAAGLRIATATVAAPVTLTSADLLDAGETVIATYPRHINFSTGGGTPSDAPADVDIVGTDVDDASVSETLVLSQVAGTVTSVNVYKTVTSLDFPAAEGTGATISVGYGTGVHVSADNTNTIAAASPTHGTVEDGDVIQTTTTAPAWDAGSLEAALDALPGYNGLAFGGILIAGAIPDTQSFDAVVAALNALELRQKSSRALIEARQPAAGETATAYRNSLDAAWLTRLDNRFLVAAGYGRYAPVEVPQARYKLRRTCLAPYGARSAALRYEQTPGLVERRIARPGGSTPSTFGGPLRGFTIYTDGALDGHDDAMNPGLAELKFVTTTTYPQEGSFAFVCEPARTRAPENDTVFNDPIRRITNVYKRIAYFELTRRIGTYLARNAGETTIRVDVAHDLDQQVIAALRAELGTRGVSFTFEIDVPGSVVTGPAPRVLWHGSIDTGIWAAGFDGILKINK